MFRQQETNPHFLPLRNDPILEFPSQSRHPQHEPPPRRSTRTREQTPHSPSSPHHPTKQGVRPTYLVEPPPQRSHHTSTTPAGLSPADHSIPQATPPPQHVAAAAPQTQYTTQTSRRSRRPSLLQGPTSQKTRPLAWLIAAFCALFWIIVIVGGLIILIVYLLFRPRNPKFDISAVTFNAAYLDMGYLLNADVTLLANFSNPNTKVNVDFSYVILDLYYEKNFIATRYVEPFSLMRSETEFANVHFMVSQVRLSMGHIMELKRQMDSGRVNFEVKGLFRTRSKLGGFLQYSYWLYAHCQITVTGPPTGILLDKKCVTKR
ncbi:NDR1/HIN1-like protein 13 [Primulina tabacum]|uniref:NDR1/HIN1-like protein 13 n=1 Tax=Primulina tabacum TaxID=48773 RepID=UPI003F5AD49E